MLPLAVFVIRVLDTRTQSLDDIVAENGSYVLDEVENCVQRPRQYDVAPADDVQAACEELIAGWYGNSPLDLVEEREEGGAIAAILLVSMVLLLAGTTFAGHDWNTGSMSNQLLFEPRRERVWLAKALAVGMLTGRARAGGPGRLLDRHLGHGLDPRPADPRARRRRAATSRPSSARASPRARRCSATR